MNMPLISVIVPTYNYSNFVEKCINSVLEQTYQKIEVIVVDDGSTDDTLTVLQKFEDRVLIYSQENMGVSAARNAGMQLAKGEYIAFLDADDWWAPSKVEKQMIAMIKSKSNISYSFYVASNLEGHTVPVTSPELNGVLGSQYLRTPLTSPIPLPCSNAIVKREQIGENAFNTKLSNSADWEFFARVSIGAHIICIPEFLTYYRIHPKSMSARTLPSFYLQAFLSFFAFLKHIGIAKLDFWAVAGGCKNLFEGILKDTIKSMPRVSSRFQNSYIYLRLIQKFRK